LSRTATLCPAHASALHGVLAAGSSARGAAIAFCYAISWLIAVSVGTHTLLVSG
jgi:hypothetical protein